MSGKGKQSRGFFSMEGSKPEWKGQRGSERKYGLVRVARVGDCVRSGAGAEQGRPKLESRSKDQVGVVFSAGCDDGRW